MLGETEIRITKALSEQAVQRNAGLRRAADVIKADSRFSGSTVKIEWIGERGVTVDKEYVFQQGASDSIGEFIDKYSDMTLPVR